MANNEKNAEILAAAKEKMQSKPLRETPKISYKLRKPQEDWAEEIGGRDGPEPTRYGDWEVQGKCTDF